MTLLLQLLFGVTSDDVYLSPAPMYHAALLRFVMSANALGCTTVLMERFDAEEFLALIERYRDRRPGRADHVCPPAQAARRGSRRYDVSLSLRCVVHAAAPCPVPVKEQMIDWFGPVIHEYYAGTEANGFVYCNSRTGWPIQVPSAGCSSAPSTSATTTSTSYPSARRGRSVRVERTSSSTTTIRRRQAQLPASAGWTTLGDVGYVDVDGLFLTDRKSYMIISGGVNIYLQEAENVLITHEKVVDVAVLGVPTTW